MNHTKTTKMNMRHLPKILYILILTFAGLDAKSQIITKEIEVNDDHSPHALRVDDLLDIGVFSVEVQCGAQPWQDKIIITPDFGTVSNGVVHGQFDLAIYNAGGGLRKAKYIFMIHKKPFGNLEYRFDEVSYTGGGTTVTITNKAFNNSTGELRLEFGCGYNALTTLDGYYHLKKSHTEIDVTLEIL